MAPTTAALKGHSGQPGWNWGARLPDGGDSLAVDLHVLGQTAQRARDRALLVLDGLRPHKAC